MKCSRLSPPLPSLCHWLKATNHCPIVDEDAVLAKEHGATMSRDHRGAVVAAPHFHTPAVCGHLDAWKIWSGRKPLRRHFTSRPIHGSTSTSASLYWSPSGGGRSPTRARTTMSRLPSAYTSTAAGCRCRQRQLTGQCWKRRCAPHR
jgi:hypothetical protein